MILTCGMLRCFAALPETRFSACIRLLTTSTGLLAVAAEKPATTDDMKWAVGPSWNHPLSSMKCLRVIIGRNLKDYLLKF